MADELLYLKFDVTGDERDAVLDCEEEVFLQAFGNTRSQLEEEYGPYLEQSVFAGVFNSAGDCLGETRIILSGPAGLKTLNDLSREPWGLDGYRSFALTGHKVAETYDIGTLGVRKEYRGRAMMISLAMFHMCLTFPRIPENQIKAMVSVMDSRFLSLQDSVGLHYNTLPGAKPGPYLGSESSSPVWIDLVTTTDRLRADYPDSYRLLVLGSGIDGVSIPGPEGLTIHTVPWYLRQLDRISS